MDRQKLLKKLEEISQRIKFGEIKIELVINRGEIVKAIIIETEEIVLFN